MKYKSDEYGSASKEIIWLKPDEKEAAVIFHTVGGGLRPVSQAQSTSRNILRGVQRHSDDPFRGFPVWRRKLYQHERQRS
jgi:hypothetical protein